MWFCLSLPVILVSFELKKLSIKALLGVLKIQFSETFEKKLWKTSIFRRVARSFSKVFLHFNKISNSLRQVLHTYSEIGIFCVPQKSPPEAVIED